MSVDYRGTTEECNVYGKMKDDQSEIGSSFGGSSKLSRKRVTTGHITIFLGILVIVVIVVLIVLVSLGLLKPDTGDLKKLMNELKEDNANDADELRRDLSQLMESAAEMELNLLKSMEENAIHSTNLSESLKARINETTTYLHYMATWTMSGNILYKHFSATPVNYTTAQEICAKHGGRLAAKVLRDPAVIRSIISKGHISSGFPNKPWIGVDDMDKNGVWEWSDGKNMNSQTTRWSPGSPDNAEGKEYCGHILTSLPSLILLNDAPCEFKLSYICEKENKRGPK